MNNFGQETMEMRAQRFVPTYQIVKPAGDGPFPTIIMIHGCGQADGPQLPYANAVLELGVASIIIDSFAPRNIGKIEAAASVCTGLQLWGRERAGDLVTAMHWAQNQSWVDVDNIHALGWSHGGWTIMDALALENQLGRHASLSDCGIAPLEKLKSAFMVYPWCGPASYTFMRGWQRAIPAHMIICGNDVVVGDVLLKAAVKKLVSKNVPIETTFLETATHAFDEIDGLHPAHKYDADLTTRATEIFADFIKKNIA